MRGVPVNVTRWDEIARLSACGRAVARANMATVAMRQFVQWYTIPAMAWSFLTVQGAVIRRACLTCSGRLIDEGGPDAPKLVVRPDN